MPLPINRFGIGDASGALRPLQRLALVVLSQPTCNGFERFGRIIRAHTGQNELAAKMHHALHDDAPCRKTMCIEFVWFPG